MRDWEPFRRRLDAAHALLERKGLVGRKRGYFLTRQLWSVGITVLPPHFASFHANVLAQGSLFAICWGTGMWFFSWRDEDLTLLTWLLRSGITGALFGLVMATYYRWQARKHKLPTWNDLPDVVEVFD